MVETVPIPEPPHEHPEDRPGARPYVDAAVAALLAFADDLTRDTAAALLPMWKFADELNDDEVRAVLERFPAPEKTWIDSGSGPGYEA
jgi:hypothetical protein